MIKLCAGKLKWKVRKAKKRQDAAEFLGRANGLFLDFEKIKGIEEEVLPVVVQDARTLEVLMLGYMNLDTLMETANERVLVLYSTSRKKRWKKGETSDEVYRVLDVLVNCEQNSLLVKVLPRKKNGGICHIKKRDGFPYKSCFYRRLLSNRGSLVFLER